MHAPINAIHHKLEEIVSSHAVLIRVCHIHTEERSKHPFAAAEIILCADKKMAKLPCNFFCFSLDRDQPKHQGCLESVEWNGGME